MEKDRNGNSIPKWNGNYLASRVNPNREAKQWVDAHKNEVGESRSIFVLGLGAGFHIRELAAQWPECKVVAVETIQALADRFQESNPDLANVDVVVSPGGVDLLNNPGVKACLGDSYVILKHGSSCRVAANKYQEFENYLTGRDPRSFCLHLRARPDDQKFFEEIEFPILKTKGLFEASRSIPLSAKDILKSVKFGERLSDEAMVWLALGELIL